MKVTVNKRAVDLSDTDLVGAGGQGQVFVKQGLAYKVYTDPQYMLPPQKIEEFKAVKHDRIVKPQDVIFKGTSPVGYTMAAVPDKTPLCKLFARPFREANNVEPVPLVEQMIEMVHAAHAGRCLIVDLNEMNFLVSGQDLGTLWAIDVDSWQTPSFPAMAIMPSVRDPHHAKFSEGTDWYSFAIVSFQLFIGIHPYRGKHPTLKGFDERMKANASVFRKDVRTPACCYPLDSIPSSLRSWYERVFEKGERTAPGALGPNQAVPAFTLAAPVSSSALTITKLSDLPSDFRDAIQIGDTVGYLCKEHLVRGANVLPVRRGTVGATMHDGVLTTWKRERNCLTADNGITVESSGSFMTRGRLLALSDMQILDIAVSGRNSLYSPTVIGAAMPNALVGDGCMVEDVFGTKVLKFSPSPRELQSVRLDSLAKHRILLAQMREHVVMLASEFNGDYYRTVYRFASGWESHDVTTTKTSGYASVNFAVTPSRIVVLIDEEDNVVLFGAKIGAVGSKVVDGSGSVSSSDKLFVENNTVRFGRGKSVYQLQVK